MCAISIPISAVPLSVPISRRPHPPVEECEIGLHMYDVRENSDAVAATAAAVISRALMDFSFV